MAFDSGRFRSAVIAAGAIVSCVQAVPGFAQTNTTERLRSSFTVVRTYVAAPSSHGEATLPSNLSVPPLYRDVVSAMLERSATFRRQCERIAGADHLTVVLSAEPVPTSMHARAWTEVARDPDGRLRALVRIGHSGRLPELIAHELEHIIEQLDGVDLRSMARLQSSGVRTCDCAGGDLFETNRAISIGERVSEEMRDRSP
jgi:hypothetical protein